MQTVSRTQLSSRLVNLLLQQHQCQTDSLPFTLASCKSNGSLVHEITSLLLCGREIYHHIHSSQIQQVVFLLSSYCKHTLSPDSMHSLTASAQDANTFWLWGAQGIISPPDQSKRSPWLSTIPGCHDRPQPYLWGSGDVGSLWGL